MTMATTYAIHRQTTGFPSSTSSSPPPQPGLQNPKEKDHQPPITFHVTIPFSLPVSPESAASRIIRNMGKFGLYYFEFVWIVLFIALVPQRKVSAIIMAATKEAAIAYLLLLRGVPASLVLARKILDRKLLVLGLLGVGTGAALVATHSGLHLLITLAATLPLVLAHAGLWSGWGAVDPLLENDDVHQYAPLV
ncbi:unnamed protein product [Cuscuta campestris]|uniref:PRA1 family protein n=1 Tax=Cuscuta campestris TaxID=132261 RepID=A0A484M7C0_9ASTE|nr:unnamed protein product [Cuscuta campestris]